MLPTTRRLEPCRIPEALSINGIRVAVFIRDSFSLKTDQIAPSPFPAPFWVPVLASALAATETPRASGRDLAPPSRPAAVQLPIAPWPLPAPPRFVRFRSVTWVFQVFHLGLRIDSHWCDGGRNCPSTSSVLRDQSPTSRLPCGRPITGPPQWLSI